MSVPSTEGSGHSIATSHEFDRALEILADRAQSEELRALATDVRKGRRPATDLLKSPDFSRLARQGMDDFERKLHAMSTAEREALHQQALALARSHGVIGAHEDPYELRWGDVNLDGSVDDDDNQPA